MVQLSAPNPAVVCFGEILWDVLPRGIFLGGAPLNVAYHLSRQGVTPRMVSAVGRDFLGDEAVRRIEGWGIDTAGIARLKARPTGIVRATLDRAGVPRFHIVRDVAWDRIGSGAPGARPPAAVVFGTLALRETPNRRALDARLATCPRATRVLDLNLRAPFDTAAAVRWALARTDFLKLNEDELARLAGARSHGPATLERNARRVAKKYGLVRLCVTAGARGAGLLWDGGWHWAAARRVVVRDTIGAGDAFLATLLVDLFVRGATPSRALARACRFGEFVAAQDGATPPYRCDVRGLPRSL